MTSVFSDVMEKKIFKHFEAFCHASQSDSERIKAYAAFVSEIYNEGASLTALVKRLVFENENVYIADSKNNRVVVLDPYYKVKFVIEKFVNEQGVDDSFAAPQGVFITKSKIVNGKEVPGRIFVCDTDKNRIELR